MEAAIELKEIICEREGFTILKNVSLAFPQGGCTIVMGLSGSGRSTLLKVAAGLLPPESGKVFVQGKDIEKMSEKEIFQFRGRSGFVFQDAALWANSSAYQNIALPLQFHHRKMTAGDVDRAIQTLVREFDFRDNLQLRPASLSSGERKIVSFIRALVLDPEILFLDDPTGSVDNASAERILRILKRLKHQGRTLILATHDPTFTSQLADHLVVLRDGVVAEQGELGSVTRSRNPYVMEVLSEILSQAATYDTDLLNLLETDSDAGND